MTEPSDEEIRYLLTKMALVVDVQQDVFGRPVLIANNMIEALPRRKGEPNPPGTQATIEADGKINLNPGGIANGQEAKDD